MKDTITMKAWVGLIGLLLAIACTTGSIGLAIGSSHDNTIAENRADIKVIYKEIRDLNIAQMRTLTLLEAHLEQEESK